MLKINSIHFGLPWIGISLLVGLVIPFMVRLFTGVFPWPLSVAGGAGLVSFVFAIGMHRDNSGKKNLSETVPYDPERQIPVLKCSICTGERIAGFKDTETGHITEVMVIRSDDDLRYFRKHYGIDTLKEEY
ncbi:MAG: hypothetical protein SPK48_09305 [Bullifex sp.]|nr:hypothetical protein [Spirochaetales bacterium]MDY5778027.1 hypothetical protein [Bullifex sp.]